MTKKYFLDLSLQDRGTFVKATMRDSDKVILDYEHEESKQVRVRDSLPNKELLIENLHYWLDCGDYKTIEESAEAYIKDRQKHIFYQLQEIRKSMKRIGYSMQCIEIVLTEVKEYQKSKT